MIDEYYEARKWDKKTGRPSEEILKELGLEDS
jgi:aldehyde:ferredoxin oxidoreductase